MRVLIFSTNLSKTFLILRRNERDMIKMYIGLHVKYRYSCHILMELELFRQIYENNQISTFMKICPVGAELFHAKGWTDGERQT